jgi:tRNA (mo5U34)-methyltransferase
VSAARVEDVQLWYHTLELPAGVVTPGWFDLRDNVDRLPWPDVRGKRCLDVGTYDGFYAFEMERRGAAEVVATDIAAHEDWDWPAAMRARGGESLAQLAGEKGRGFEVAKAALGSEVCKLELSAYRLDPESIGTFDVVVCGSLMLHLRDPVRALEAMRSVCNGSFMSIEEVSVPLSLAFRRRPVAEVRFDEQLCQWWVVNVAGHKQMVQIAGFDVVRQVGPFTEPFGPGNPATHAPVVGLRGRARRLRRYPPLGPAGVAHAALLAHPRLKAPPIRP